MIQRIPVGQVGVAIDQARQQGFIRKINHRSIGRNCERRAHRLNLSVLNHYHLIRKHDPESGSINVRANYCNLREGH